MYWNPHSVSSVESLLDKHETTLETILLVDNIILQVRSGESRLISFLSEPDNLMKLFRFAISTDLPEDKAIKYRKEIPYVACEVFCSDNGRFIEAIKKNVNLIRPLWSFLINLRENRAKSQQDDDIPNLSITNNSPSAIQNAAIFFSRLNIFLLNKIPLWMIAFLREKIKLFDHVSALDLLLENLDLQPICELVYRIFALHNAHLATNHSTPSISTSSTTTTTTTPTLLLSNNSSDNNLVDIFEWFRQESFYSKLALRLGHQFTPDTHIAITQFLQGLFILPFPDDYPRYKLFESLLKESWLKELFLAIFPVESGSEENAKSSLICGVGILSLIVKGVTELKPNNQEQQQQQISTDKFCEFLADNFESLYTILGQREKGLKQFGMLRLKVVELIVDLVGLEDERVAKKFEKFRTGTLLLNLFFEYPENNFLHHLVCAYVKGIFKGSRGIFKQLVNEIIKECKITEKIAAGQRLNDALVEEPKRNRLPFMGHLMILGEEVIKKLEEIEAEDGEEKILDNEEEWDEFRLKAFKETKERDETILGGIKPPVSMGDLIDEEDLSVLDYNAVFSSGSDEQLARYFTQQIIGNIPDYFLYSQYDNDQHDSPLLFSCSSDNDKGHEEDENDEDLDVDSIEIPFTRGFEEMFESVLSIIDNNYNESENENDEFESEELNEHQARDQGQKLDQG